MPEKNIGAVPFFILFVMERKFVVSKTSTYVRVCRTTPATTETKVQKKLKSLLSLDICVSSLTCGADDTVQMQ